MLEHCLQDLLKHVGSSDASAPDSERLAGIKAAAYEASDALMLTDAPLLYTPGQLALTATLAACSKVGSAAAESTVGVACRCESAVHAAEHRCTSKQVPGGGHEQSSCPAEF